MTIILTKPPFQLSNRVMFYTHVCVYVQTYVAEQQKEFHKAHTRIQNSPFCYALFDTDTLLHP